VGIEDYLGREDVILAVEWADKILKILPRNIIKIKFETTDKNSRRISTKIARA
jgi:tRNA A37 threonylcarbamoyladenosine biosynthesis protein TsaE